MLLASPASLSVYALLEKIYSESDSVQLQIIDVSANTEQQSIATEEIALHVEHVVESARDNAEIARQTNDMARHLKQVTNLAQGGIA